MRLEHEHLRLDDGLVAQRQVHCHLVTIKVGVKCRTCKRVQLNCLALDELGLECLDTQTVQCRCTVQKHWVTLHHILEDVPHDGLLAIDNLLGALDRLDNAALNEFANHEGLV